MSDRRESQDKSAITSRQSLLTPSCPLPITNYKEIVLAHGGGGKLSRQLIDKIVMPQFRNDLLEQLHDGAIFSVADQRLAFTTDSFVVNPIFFPGGDIGSLSIHGTLNDLAMCGARPLYLSASFILEEGLPMEDFWRIVQSMHKAADAATVKLVTGDTKVVDRGKADKIFINTSGIGAVPDGVNIDPARAHALTALQARWPFTASATAPATSDSRAALAWATTRLGWPGSVEASSSPERRSLPMITGTDSGNCASSTSSAPASCWRTAARRSSNTGSLANGASSVMSAPG